MYDAIIIGAGLSGLAAGIRLAHYEKRVCILERHTTIGGLNSFYRLRGRNYDVGLHAVTNFTPKGTKRGPLARVLRQLRISWNDFALHPQVGSSIVFPSARLEIGNDLDVLRSSIAQVFPSQVAGFDRMAAAVPDYDDLPFDQADASAREWVGQFVSEPLLVEMLFCPLMYYGSACEDDMDLAQFFIMFRSIFCEGFARPVEGIRPILKLLVRRYKELGGELRLRAGVRRLVHDGERATGVELDDGERLETAHVLSSAGYVETMQLCGRTGPEVRGDVGRLGFVESTSTLDCAPRDLGIDRTIVFFSTDDRFHWRRPDDLVDPRSGVLCMPSNFQLGDEIEGAVRITALANYDGWAALPRPEYEEAKHRWYDVLSTTAARILPDFRPHVVDVDMFTPTTIVRYTGHANGAIYGATKKRYDGRTFLQNVSLCGTDQGYVGIIGALFGGIAAANGAVLVRGQ